MIKCVMFFWGRKQNKWCQDSAESTVPKVLLNWDLERASREPNPSNSIEVLELGSFEKVASGLKA